MVFLYVFILSWCLREDLYIKKKEKTGKFCFKLSHLKLNLFREVQRDMRQRSGSHFIISVFLSKGPAIERASEPPPQCTSASLSVCEACASVCASAAANSTVINSCRSKKKKRRTLQANTSRHKSAQHRSNAPPQKNFVRFQLNCKQKGEDVAAVLLFCRVLREGEVSQI